MFSWLTSFFTGVPQTNPNANQQNLVQPNQQQNQKNDKNTIEMTTFHENWSINELKEGYFHEIFKYLNERDLIRCRLVCKTWKKYLDTLPELTVTFPNDRYSSLFKNVERLIVDPGIQMDCSSLVTRLSNLTS